MRVRRSSQALAAVAVVALLAVLSASCQSPFAVLRGHVTTTTGTSEAGIAVVVYSNTAATIVAQTATDADGDYSLLPADLPDGTYRIRFGTDTWWDSATGWADATPVTATADTPAVVDATVDVATGSVAGVVTDAGQPAADVTVEALNTVTSWSVATTTTASDGSYTFAALPAGTYVFRFSATGLTTRYNGSVLSQGAAAVVTVTGGATITGVNTTLATESTITGEVTDGTNPLANILVIAIEPTSKQPMAVAATGADGTFVLSALDAVPYTVSFLDLSGKWLPLVYGSTSTDPGTGTHVTPVNGTIDIGTVVLAPNPTPPA
jgi:5-hydroxyisourate hydrolase-like protein (transthyretin family)